jgi:tripartite-type tricarboxylate transporter receptor subunit TctC
VPYAAGGVVDGMARLIGSAVSDSMGQPVIVDNKPGASAIIGIKACADAAPNGYTVCLAIGDPFSFNPQLFSKLPYNPDKDFVPVINLARSNMVLAATGKAPFSSYKDMIAYAKSNPGKLNWGTWGPATLPDLYYRWIASRTGVDIQPIPYKGGFAESGPALYAGEVDLSMMGFGAMFPQLAAGKVKPLAASGANRSVFMPELPSLGEEGVDPGIENFFGAWAPAGTPAAIVQRLNAEFTKAINAPKGKDFYKKFTLEFVANTPDEFAAYTRRDRENAARLFKTLGIEPSAAPQ